MSPILCAEALADFLREVPLKNTDVHVYVGIMPVATNKTERSALKPYVIVQPLEIVDDTENEVSTCSLQMLIGTTSKADSSAEAEERAKCCYGLYHVLELIRQGILDERTINQQYILTGEIVTQVPDDQPYPDFWGTMQVSYKLTHKKKAVASYFG